MTEVDNNNDMDIDDDDDESAKLILEIKPDPEFDEHYQCSIEFDPNSASIPYPEELDEITGIKKIRQGKYYNISFPKEETLNVKEILQQEYTVEYTDEVAQYETSCNEDPLERVRELMDQNSNFMITGEGGTGKSYMIYSCYMHLLEQNKRVALTAMTGVAAQLLECGAEKHGGLEVKAHTLHSFLGLPLKETDINTIEKCVTMRGCIKNWLETDYLIIDEVSMLRGELLNTIYTISQKTFVNQKARMKFILVGDMFQLGPPQPPSTTTNIPKPDYCFNAHCWNSVFSGNIVHLTVNHRMKNDENWKKLLGSLREGDISQEQRIALLERDVMALDEPIPPDILRLFPTREQANAINNERISTWMGQEKIYEATIADVKCKDGNMIRNINIANQTPDVKKQINRIAESCIRELMRLGKNEDVTPLRLKVGVPIVCNKNKKSKTGGGHLVKNGMRGKVVKLMAHGVKISIDGGEPIDIRYETHQCEEIAENGKLYILNIRYLPISLAFALTIHRIQGATVEDLYIKFVVTQEDGTNASACFDNKLVYVALSRATSIKGVFLEGIEDILDDCIGADEEVINFYKNISTRKKEPVKFRYEKWMDKKINLKFPPLIELYAQSRTKKVLERERRQRERRIYRQRTEENTRRIANSNAMHYAYHAIN